MMPDNGIHTYQLYDRHFSTSVPTRLSTPQSLIQSDASWRVCFSASKTLSRLIQACKWTEIASLRDAQHVAPRRKTCIDISLNLVTVSLLFGFTCLFGTHGLRTTFELIF